MVFSAEHKYTIAVVEDDDDDFLIINNVLSRSPEVRQILRFYNGEEIMRHLKGEENANNLPNLVLLDLNMPVKNGYEVLWEIKRDGILSLIPVVVFTTSRNKYDIQRVYGLHANSFITKPLDLESFEKVVKDIQHYWLGISRLPETSTEARKP